MIITTGKHIVIEVGDFIFRRTAETPGMVTVTSNRAREPAERISLPGNNSDGAMFIAAYQRILKEDVAYKDTSHESPKWETCPDCIEHNSDSETAPCVTCGGEGQIITGIKKKCVWPWDVRTGARAAHE